MKNQHITLEAIIEQFKSSDYWHPSSSLKIDIVTSGSSGGNCYGDSARYFMRDSDEVMAEYDKFILAVAHVLENLNAEVSVMRFYILTKELIRKEFFRHNEWYGNYSDYDCYRLDAEALLQFLQSP